MEEEDSYLDSERFERAIYTIEASIARRKAKSFKPAFDIEYYIGNLFEAGEGLLPERVVPGLRAPTYGTLAERSQDNIQNHDQGGEGDSSASAIGLTGWLEQQRQSTLNFHAVPMSTSICPGLRLAPYDHQRKALAMIEYNMKRLKAILIADPPGFGKTLPPMIATVRAIQTAGLFSLVIVPPNCADQWVEEYNKFFEQGTVSVFNLRDPTTPYYKLRKYDVVVTTSSFAMDQYGKWLNFKAIMKTANAKGSIASLPTRPDISIFSEGILQSGKRFPILVLDEAQSIKFNSLTYKAISHLAQHSDMVIMLSGSLIQNSWLDLFGMLAFVSGHPITSPGIMRSAFGSYDDKGIQQPPSGLKLDRLAQLLSTFVVRRAEQTVSRPDLEEETVEFELSKAETFASENAFANFMNSLADNSAGQEDTDQSREAGDPRRWLAWNALEEAWQHTMHPWMVSVSEFERYRGRSNKANLEKFAHMPLSQKGVQQWEDWRQDLQANENWLSSRINAIIHEFNRQRSNDPAAAFLIFEESVYFLDIVEIAFKNMTKPVECFRLDDRGNEIQRSDTLAAFSLASGIKVLLISRGAGGTALSIPSANIVFLCSPWWKACWEEHAIKRVWRPGQTRPVTVCRFVATNGSSDGLRIQIRAMTNLSESALVDTLAKSDDTEPKLMQ